jgi:hypothetical protein
LKEVSKIIAASDFVIKWAWKFSALHYSTKTTTDLSMRVTYVERSKQWEWMCPTRLSMKW